MADAARDQNRVPAIIGVSSIDLETPTRIAVNPVTNAMLIDGASLDGRFVKLNNANAFNDYVWPNADGNASDVLTTDGNGNLSWAAGGGGGTPGGSDTQVQFNDGGNFGGDSGFTFNKTTNAVTIGVASGGTGSVILTGTTSGAVTLSVADAAGTWTMKLPTTDGDSGQFLQTDGSGNTTWATPSGGGDISGTIADTQIAFGTAADTIGGSDTLTYDGMGTLTVGEEGGTFTIQGVSATTTDADGADILFAGGDGDGAGSGGSFVLTTGQAGATGDGGNIQIAANSGGATSGAGGTVSINSGNAQAGDSNGGDITFIAGTGAGSGADGKIRLETDGTDSAVLLGEQIFYPAANDSIALGTGTNSFSDLFLASGGVIDFANGTATISHSSSVVTIPKGLSVGDATTNSTSAITINSERSWTLKGGQSGASTSLDLQTNTDAKHFRWLTQGGSVAFDATLNNTLTSCIVQTYTPWVFNEGGADADTRIEGDTDANLIFADASTDRVGIGNNAPAVKLDVTGEIRASTAGTNSASVVTVGGTQTLTNKTLTSPTVGGTALLSEGGSVGYDPSLSADGTWTGITITATAGYTQAFGDLVYLDPTDSRWEAADANSASGADGDARGILGMVVVAGTDGNACTILLNGVIRADAKFPTFTINNPIYVSETAGSVTQTQPTTTDVVIRIVGAALTADSMYFNPDQTWITHT